MRYTLCIKVRASSPGRDAMTFINDRISDVTEIKINSVETFDPTPDHHRANVWATVAAGDRNLVGLLVRWCNEHLDSPFPVGALVWWSEGRGITADDVIDPPADEPAQAKPELSGFDKAVWRGLIGIPDCDTCGATGTSPHLGSCSHR